MLPELDVSQYLGGGASKLSMGETRCQDLMGTQGYSTLTLRSPVTLAGGVYVMRKQIPLCWLPTGCSRAHVSMHASACVSATARVCVSL